MQRSERPQMGKGSAHHKKVHQKREQQRKKERKLNKWEIAQQEGFCYDVEEDYFYCTYCKYHCGTVRGFDHRCSDGGEYIIEIENDPMDDLRAIARDAGFIFEDLCYSCNFCGYVCEQISEFSHKCSDFSTEESTITGPSAFCDGSGEFVSVKIATEVVSEVAVTVTEVPKTKGDLGICFGSFGPTEIQCALKKATDGLFDCNFEENFLKLKIVADRVEGFFKIQHFPVVPRKTDSFQDIWNLEDYELERVRELDAEHLALDQYWQNYCFASWQHYGMATAENAKIRRKKKWHQRKKKCWFAEYVLPAPEIPDLSSKEMAEMCIIPLQEDGFCIMDMVHACGYEWSGDFLGDCQKALTHACLSRCWPYQMIVGKNAEGYEEVHQYDSPAIWENYIANSLCPKTEEEMLLLFNKYAFLGTLIKGEWNVPVRAEAAGPLEWIGKKLGFGLGNGLIDAIMAKIRELFGPVWHTCAFLADFFTKTMKEALNWVSNMIEEHEEIYRAMKDGFVFVAVTLFSFIAVNSISKLCSLIGIPEAVFDVVMIGLGIFMLVKFFQFTLDTAAARAQKIRDRVKVIFDEAATDNERLGSSDPNDPMEVIIDVPSQWICGGEEVKLFAAAPLIHMDMGAFWKLLLLFVPVASVGLAKSLSMAKDAACLYGGREAAGKMLGDIVNAVQEMYYNFTGQKNEFLSLLGTFSRVDFDKWRKEVAEMTSCTVHALSMGPSERLLKLRKLVDQGDMIMGFMDSKAIPQVFCNIFNDTYKLLLTAVKTTQEAVAMGKWRKKPFVIWLYGVSQIGKSTNMKYIIDDLMSALDYPKEGNIYARNNGERHWNGYKNQTCVVMDDFGAVQREVCDEQLLINMVSCAPYPLDMANLVDKGATCFTSDFILISANQPGLSPAAKVHDKAAFYLRRSALYEVTLNPDGGDNRAHNLFQRKDCTDPFLPLGGRQNYDEMIADLAAEARRHFVRQETLLAASSETIWEDLTSVAKDQVACFMSQRPDAHEALFIQDAMDFHEGMGYLMPTGEWISPCAATRALEKFLSEQGPLFFLDQVKPINHKQALFFMSAERTSFLNMLVAGRAGFWAKRFFQLNDKDFSKMILKKIDPPSLQTWWGYVKEKFLELPMWAKVIVGALGIFVVGAPVIGLFFRLANIGKLGIAGVLSGSSYLMGCGSVTSSGDNFTRKIGSKFKKERFVLEGAAGPVENAKNLITKKVEMDVICNQVAFKNKENGYYMNGVALGGRDVLFTYHVWAAMKQGVYSVYSLSKSGHTTYLDHALPMVRLEKPRKDLVVVRLDKNFPLFPRSALDYFPTDLKYESKCHTIFCTPEWENGTFEFYRADCLSQYVAAGVKYNTAAVETMVACESLKYQVVEEDCADYFTVGQCGSIMLGWKDQKPTILSMHYAKVVLGNSPTKPSNAGYGEIVLKQELEEAIKRLPGNSCVLEEDTLIGAGYARGDFLDTDCVKHLGNLKKKAAPTLPKNTTIKQSLIFDALCETVRKPYTEPAILHNGDERIVAKDIDILAQGMKKYNKVAQCMTGEFFEDALDEIFLPFEGETFLPCTEHETLNGRLDEEYFDAIVASTSEGYPYVLDRKNGESGKARLLEGLPGSWSLGVDSQLKRDIDSMEEVIKEKVPCIVGIDCPKDERLPLRKIYEEPKTRLFTILPFPYNYLTRKYFLPFVASTMRKHNDIPTKVGINPYSVEWDHFYTSLKAKGDNWFNGDYKSFDGITPPAVLEGIAQRIARFYPEEYRQRMIHLVMACTYRLGICGQDLYRVSSGIPSGFALTVIINSFVNEFFLRFAWKKMCKEREKDWKIEDYVHFGVYGDDNLVSVKTTANFFNLKSIAQFLDQYGVTLKDGSDKTKTDLPAFNPPIKCDFLKRRMISSGARVACPLDVASMEERLYYIRDCEQGDMLALEENVESFLMEAFFHGKKYYEKWVQILRDAFQRSKITWNSQKSYKEQEIDWLAGKKVEPMQEVRIVRRREAQIVIPGVEIVDFVAAQKLRKSKENLVVYVGNDLPVAARSLSNVMHIAAIEGRKFPFKSNYFTIFKRLNNYRAVVPASVYFTSVLTHPALYAAAYGYASYISPFKFSESIRQICPNESEALAAIESVKGW